MSKTKERERQSVTLQLWPGGESISVSGEGPEMRVRKGYPSSNEPWRKPTAEERRAVRTEQLAEMYADRDIWHCDSSLVDDCLKLAYEHSGDFFEEWSYENISNVYADPSSWDLTECRDWCDEHGGETADCPNPWEMKRPELVELLTGAGIECRDDESDDTLRDAVIANMDDETIDGLEAWREAVREEAGEHAAEIYEWWRVDKWLAAQLNEIGECVLDNAYGTWWGRCATGQGLIMDGVLQRVAAKFAS